jgi:multidrug efflux pump subunit AcrA (membrane-fusion protein)
MFVTGFLLNCRQTESRAESNPPPIEIKAVVHPAQTVTVTAQIDGQVDTIGIREGTRVAADAPIVQLANAVVEREVAYARAQMQSIDARAAQGRRPPVVASARPRDNLEITSKVLNLKRARLDKMKQLRSTGDVTAREVEYAEVEYLAALRDYNNERRAAGIVVAPATDDTGLLRAERERVAADQRYAAQREALLRVISPIAGVVTRIHVTKGQALFPRDPIAEISDTTTVHVRGAVAPELLRYIKPGMRVDVRIMSVPPRSFADEVEFVNPAPASATESSAATVVVTLPNPDGSLQPNTSAMITFRPGQ